MGDSKTSPDQTDRLHPLQRAVWRALEPYRKRRINVAFSGGNDSTALLSVLASLREPLGLQVRALHVDHNWSEESSTWKTHCENFCRRLDIPFESFTLKRCDDSGLRPNSGKFREARAREQRYQWFSSVCGIEDLLITAHHLEDQGETLFLRLMRGSAVRGLGAMRPAQRLYGMMVLRPLLEVSKQRLQEWVAEHNLEIVFDGSNLEEAYEKRFSEFNEKEKRRSEKLVFFTLEEAEDALNSINNQDTSFESLVSLAPTFSKCNIATFSSKCFGKT